MLTESKSLSPVINSLKPSPEPINGRPTPKKSVVFHPFDQKSTFLCKFCGGKSCKHENWLTHPESAIKGLNSDWISNNILAMQRPSSRIIKEFNIVSQFKEKGIDAVFNLQEPGEHPFCGDGIHATSGFSYYPEEFSDHGIYFFNFGWRDMTATSTDVILKIVKQMSFSLTNGSKVAVHCHAGRGRTGLIIAAWLIFHENMSAKDAIKQMRTRRKDAISKTSQEKILYQFEKEIKESRLIFFPSPKYSLEEYLYHQKNLCALSLGSAERYVPRVVLIALERLDTLIQSNVCRVEDVLASFYALGKKECFKDEWGSNHEKFLKLFKERINVNNYEVSDIEDPRYLTQILLDFLDGFSSSPIEQRFINAVQSKIHETKTKLTKDIKDQFFKELNKKEFFLLECFARFFASILAQSEDSNAEIVTATLRVCISLVGSKKKLDKLFLKRNLIKDHNQDDQVMHLKIFLLKWIENFNEEFTELFMLHKSPLRISERKVTQKMIRKGIRMNSYLSKVLDAESKHDLDNEVNSPVDPSIIEEVQEEREAGSPDLKVPFKKPIISQQDEHKVSPAGSTTQKANNAMRIRLIHLSETGLTTNAKSGHALSSTQFATPRGNISKKTISVVPSLSPEALMQNNETPRVMSDRGKAKTFISPKNERVVTSSRRTLIKVGNDHKTQENVSSLAKLNIEKHYDDLFGDNKVGSLDSLDPGSLARIPSIGKDVGVVQGIMDQIKKLNAEQQDLILQNLLEIQAGRNSQRSKALF